MHEKCDSAFRAGKRHGAQRAKFGLDHVVLDALQAAKVPWRKVLPLQIRPGRLPARLRPSPNMIAQPFTPASLLTCATTALASILVGSMQFAAPCACHLAKACLKSHRPARNSRLPAFLGATGVAGLRQLDASGAAGATGSGILIFATGSSAFGSVTAQSLTPVAAWNQFAARPFSGFAATGIETFRVFLCFGGKRRCKIRARFLLFLVVAHAQGSCRQILQHFLQRQKQPARPISLRA